MELRDVIELLAGLDDERRAITNGLHRALDALERAVLPEDRFGVTPAMIGALHQAVQQGDSADAALSEIAGQIRARTLEEARQDGARLALLSPGDTSAVASALARLADRVGGAHDSARIAHEQAGSLRALLARRKDVASAMRRLSETLAADEITAELLETALAARLSDDRIGPLAARDFVAAAERRAAESTDIAGLASACRALDEAIATGGDADAAGADVAGLATEAVRSLWRAHEDARRRLASVERETLSRQEIARGAFQAISKASEVLEKVDALERLPSSERLVSGALFPLQAACLEQGILSVLSGLQAVRVERSELDAALSKLSAELGALFSLLEDPKASARLVPAWDDIATVDARTQESEWEAACRDALSVRRDAQGMLSVAPEALAVMASADSLGPLGERLFRRVEAKMREVQAATERLEALDLALSELCHEGGPVGQRASACKAALTHFLGHALHVMGECHGRFEALLQGETTGFPLVEARVAPFHHYRESAGADEGVLLAAMDRTLRDLRVHFAAIEAGAMTPGADATQARAADAAVREQAASLQRDAAASLAGLARVRELVLPPLSPPVREALERARALRESAANEPSRDALGESLEALLGDRLRLASVPLPADAECRPLQGLRAERDRRLLAVLGASLTLGYRLLGTLVEEHEALEPAAREAHFEWIDELAAHVQAEMELHATLLDEHLTDLPNNAARLEHHAVALNAHAEFLQRLQGTEAGMSLVHRHGPSFFERLEAPLGQIGRTLVNGLRVNEADWRITGNLESVMELLDLVLDRVPAAQLRSDVAEAIRTTRRRAEELRDAISERADSEGNTRPGIRLFR